MKAKTQIQTYLFLELILYVPVNYFSVILGGFLGWTRTKQRIKCVAQGLNTVPPGSSDIKIRSHSISNKHSTIEPLCPSIQNSPIKIQFLILHYATCLQIVNYFKLKWSIVSRNTENKSEKLL